MKTAYSNFCILSLFLQEMTETQDIPQDEPFLGTIDILLLIGLVVGGAYWLMKRNRKEEKPAPRSYSIQ